MSKHAGDGPWFLLLNTSQLAPQILKRFQDNGGRGMAVFGIQLALVHRDDVHWCLNGADADYYLRRVPNSAWRYLCTRKDFMNVARGHPSFLVTPVSAAAELHSKLSWSRLSCSVVRNHFAEVRRTLRAQTRDAVKKYSAHVAADVVSGKTTTVRVHRAGCMTSALRRKKILKFSCAFVCRCLVVCGTVRARDVCQKRRRCSLLL